MKKLFLSTILISYFTSCTIILPAVLDSSKGPRISNSDAMDQYKNQRDVVNSFGLPNNKGSFEELEIWYYNMGSASGSYSRTNGTVSNSLLNNGLNVNSGTSTNTFSYNKYVEFHFDENNNVIHWRTKGVNYGNIRERKKAILINSYLGACADLLIGLFIWNANY